MCVSVYVRVCVCVFVCLCVRLLFSQSPAVSAVPTSRISMAGKDWEKSWSHNLGIPWSLIAAPRTNVISQTDYKTVDNLLPNCVVDLTWGWRRTCRRPELEPKCLRTGNPPTLSSRSFRIMPTNDIRIFGVHVCSLSSQ